MAEYENIKILINGVEIPAPSDYEVGYEDIDAEALRDVSTGILERNRIRADVQKISLSYLLKDLESITAMYKLISPQSFEVEVWDDTKGERVTKVMYAGPKKHSFIRVQKGIKGKAIKFSLIEV